MIVSRNASFSKQWQQWLVIIAIPLLFYVYLTSFYYPFFADDAFISLRYSERFLEGKGLTWNDGEQVEGYSNLLWVLLTALIGSLGVDLLDAGRVVCTLATFSTGAALIYFARIQQIHGLTVLAGLLVLGLSHTVAVWSIGGLESSTHMALLTWIAVLGWPQFHDKTPLRNRYILPTLLGLVAINRPDGIIFVIVFLGLFLTTNLHNSREIIRIALIGLVLPALQLLFRLYYYHEIVPNTFYAKVAFNEQRLHEGIQYVKNGLYHFIPMLVAVIVLLPFGVKKIHTFLQINYLSIPIIIWLAAVSIGGGDIFPAYRHLVPIIGFISLLLMITMNSALQIRYWQTILIVMSALVGFVSLQQKDPEMYRAKHEVWEWRCADIGKRLHEIFKDQTPLVAVTAAGTIPFYSKLPTLDMFGLNDAYLTKHKPSDFGYGPLAHELFNSSYILSRRPDIIIFDDGSHDNAAPEFKQSYHLRWINVYNIPAALWVRNDSPYAAMLNNQ
ncbi:MAG: hypothetical protein EBR02_03705 [Alphaproteobacteria bacterium]|nr:hypothetical protein [Alphaproteobacteria bacterium]